MSPSTGYGLHFVISRRAFDVMPFEEQVTFEAHHSKKFSRYEKMKGISSSGGHVNFLFLGMKMH